MLCAFGGITTLAGQATLSRFADILHNGLTEMRGTTAPRLLLIYLAAENKPVQLLQGSMRLVAEPDG